jgi:hypothetical protein
MLRAGKIASNATRSSWTTKMLLRNITQLCSSDKEKILGADAIDSIARSIERIEEDLWALKNDMETVTMAQRAAARAA